MMQVNSMVKCPKCGKINFNDSKFCSSCGSSLNTILICPNCGKKFSNDEKFCTACGNKLVNEKQQSINELCEQAKLYYDNRNYEKTIECCDKIIKLDSSNDEILCLKGNSYRRLKEDKKAIEAYNETLKFNPYNKGALKSLGLSYQDVGDYKNALTYYNKFLELYGYNKYIHDKKLYCERTLDTKRHLEDKLEYQIERIEENEYLCFESKTDEYVYFSKNRYVTAVYSINKEGKLNFSEYIFNVNDDKILEAYCKHQLIENDYKDYTITNNYVYLTDEDDLEEQYHVEEIINKIHKLMLDCDYEESIYLDMDNY